MVLRCCLTVVCCALASPALAQQPAPAAAPPRTILVMPVKTTNVQEQAAQQVTMLLAESLSGRPDLKILTMEDVQQLATHEQMRSLMGCDSNLSCVAELSLGAGADQVVSASLGRVGKQYTLNAALVEAKTANVVNRVGVTADDLLGLPDAVKQLVARLMGWSAETPAAGTFKLPTGKKVSLAVMDLVANGVDATLTQNLTQVLSSEVKRVDGTSVISKDDIEAILQMQATKAMAGCDEASCLAEIGGALGVEKLVVGTVGKLADANVVSLRLISVKDTTVENRVTETFRGPEEQLIRAVKQAARKLLGVTVTRPGALSISCNEDNAQVFVDGTAVGNVPLPPVENLTAGVHQVEVRKRGFLAWAGEVYVEPDDTSAVWAALEAVPLRWYQRWWVWTIIAGVSAGAALGALALVGATTVGGAGAIGAWTSRPPDTGSVGVSIAE